MLVLPDLSLLGKLPEGEYDWVTASLLSFGVMTGKEEEMGMADC